MYDPQTSGGLLVGVDAGDAGVLVQALHEAGVPAQPIGHVTAGKPEIILRGDR
jgi:hydrogenase maturation factor